MSAQGVIKWSVSHLNKLTVTCQLSEEPDKAIDPKRQQPWFENEGSVQISDCCLQENLAQSQSLDFLEGGGPVIVASLGDGKKELFYEAGVNCYELLLITRSYAVIVCHSTITIKV